MRNQRIKDITERIVSNGGKLYLVGGAVRDQLMGLNPIDRDYCVTGLAAQQFQNLFPDAILTGKDFPVFWLMRILLHST